jgi:hypothetical protein
LVSEIAAVGAESLLDFDLCSANRHVLSSTDSFLSAPLDLEMQVLVLVKALLQGNRRYIQHPQAQMLLWWC